MDEELRKALEVIDREAATLTGEIRAKSVRLDQLRSTREALAKLLENAPESSSGGWYSSLISGVEDTAIENLGITDAIRRILLESLVPMTPINVKEALVSGGLSLDGYANPHAVIHNTLKRLEKQGELLSVRDPSGRVYAYTTKWFGGESPVPVE
jgi:hypothetical protein